MRARDDGKREVRRSEERRAKKNKRKEKKSKRNEKKNKKTTGGENEKSIAAKTFPPLSPKKNAHLLEKKRSDDGAEALPAKTREGGGVSSCFFCVLVLREKKGVIEVFF